MRNRYAIGILVECAVLAAALTLLAVPFGSPFSYYASLIVLAVIPGRGFPRLMFGSDLSIAEGMLFTFLISIGLTTATVFGLLVGGVRLDVEVLKTAAIALAVLSSTAALLGLFLHRSDAPVRAKLGDGAAFVLGVLASTGIGIGIMNLV